ncbi:MAG: TRAP transporter substrate-binding protein DctP [Proteobacteria bacterium]|nr:TRAP transporter substrate-binding protein DctP [Pseudomonadota bacterium]
MKKLTAAILSLIALIWADQALAQTIKLGTLAPEGSVWHNVLRDMAEDWRELSNGRIQVRIYPGGVAGDDADMVRKVRIGQLQAAALTGEGLSNIAEEISVFQMPMLLRSDAELDFVRDRLAPSLEALLEQKGFKVLYWSEVGWVYLFSNKPVRRPADLKPLKIWVWAGDAAWADALKDAGYRPVPLPATEIHMALQSGLVDAFSTTPVAALSFQWFGQAKNMMAMKWAPLTAAVVISTRAWERIPEDLRPEIMAAAQRAGDKAKIQIRSLEAEAIAAMEGYGLTVNQVTPEMAAEWRAEIEATYPKLLGKSIPEDIYNQVAALLEEYRGAGGQ